MEDTIEFVVEIEFGDGVAGRIGCCSCIGSGNEVYVHVRFVVVETVIRSLVSHDVVVVSWSWRWTCSRGSCSL